MVSLIQVPPLVLMTTEKGTGGVMETPWQLLSDKDVSLPPISLAGGRAPKPLIIQHGTHIDGEWPEGSRPDKYMDESQ